MTPAWKRVSLVALALALGACTTPTAERQWQKVDATSSTAQNDEAERLTAAGIERVPRVYAGTAGITGRNADASGRGYAAYVACMEAKGYTRPDR